VTILFIASLLLPPATGILLAFLFCPSLKNGAAGRAFGLFAGSGLGLGIASCLAFLCLLAGVPRSLPIVDLGVALLAGICWFLFSRRPAGGEARPLPETRKRSRFEILLAGVVSLELIASAASFILAFLKEPHGRWDAWLIWNMHARFLFRGGDHWPEAFASGLDWSHWDYPLLLPLAIARSWSYTGGESLPVPAVMAALFTFLTLGILCASLCLLRSRSQGYLAAMILMGTPFFIAMGASQFADIPLAFFILTTLALLLFQSRSAEGWRGALILAGLAAGLCAWTKNEGLLFFLVATAALFGTTIHAAGWKAAFRRTTMFLAGAVPVLLIIVYFKLRLAPANDLMAGVSWAALSDKLLDWGRYEATARAFFITGISFTQGLIDVRLGMRLNPGAVNIILLTGYLLFAGIRIDREDRPGLLQTGASLVLMPAGYFFVYVLTPLDLAYHLATSLNRLFLQLWPGVILLIFMIAGTPETSAPEKTTGPITPYRKSHTAKGKKQQRNMEVK
jgi:hypothetical protein